jgi:uncharacterized protein YdhG (YjbR/CyaY superfamily)
MAAARTHTPIDEYLRNVPVGQRVLLEELRTKILSVVPLAEECISYGMPAFRLPGGVVAGFAATKTGGSYYPFSGTTLATVAPFTRAYDQSKSALRFVAEKPLPLPLVRRLIKARLAEIEATPKKKRTRASSAK